MATAEIEQIVMTIISMSGEAKRHCFEALHLAGEGQVDAALANLAEAETLLTEVHKVHAGLLVGDKLPEIPQLMFLLVHAEDIFMTTMSEKELIKALIRAGVFDKQKHAETVTEEQERTT